MKIKLRFISILAIMFAAILIFFNLSSASSAGGGSGVAAIGTNNDAIASGNATLADDETDTDGDDRLEVHFLDARNGDCTFIKCGNTEILIDVGNREQLKGQIKRYVEKYCTDGVLECVIMSHGDADHIYNSQVLENLGSVQIGNIIDFDGDAHVGAYSSATYKNYVSRREKLIKTGTNYRGSASFWTDGDEPREKQVNVQNINEQCSGDEDLKLFILYNPYYFMKREECTTGKSCYANVISVSVLLQYGKSRYLTTGDLEEFDSGQNSYPRINGETQLVKYNNSNGLLSKVTLYKAAHHGSKTSNSAELLDVIKPQYVHIPCYAGNNEEWSDGTSKDNDEVDDEDGQQEESKFETFPRQAALNNILKYTDYITIPSYYGQSGNEVTYYGYVDYYLDIDGNVTVSHNDAKFGDENHSEIADENFKDGKPVPITQTKTDWFRLNRQSLLSIITFDGYEAENSVRIGNCTLIKYGHYDILVDCGSRSGLGAEYSTNFINKVKDYCCDGVLELVIVTTSMLRSIQQMADIYHNDEVYAKGVLHSFDIQALLDFGNIPDPTNSCENSVYKDYVTARNKLAADGMVYLKAKEYAGQSIEITSDLSITVLNNKHYGQSKDRGVCFTVNFMDKKMLFTGDLSGKAEEDLVAENKNQFNDIIFYRASNFGWDGANSQKLLSAIKSSCQGPLFIAVQGVAGHNFEGKNLLTRKMCDDLINATNKTGKGRVYVTTEKSAGTYKPMCGDLTFSVFARSGEVISYTMKCGVSGDNTLTLQDTDYYKEMCGK